MITVQSEYTLIWGQNSRTKCPSYWPTNYNAYFV